MSRGVLPKNLEGYVKKSCQFLIFPGLRKRIANLFLQFVENPEFNPQASMFQKNGVSHRSNVASPSKTLTR